MSHIISFEIQGLAGRSEPLAVKLNRDTNIFFGLNGCGKTSLLKILHAAMANETGLLANVPFTAAEVRIRSERRDIACTRSIEKKGRSGRRRTKARGGPRYQIGPRNRVVVFGDTDAEEHMEWACTPATPKRLSSTRWEHQYLPTSRLHVSDERTPDVGPFPGDVPWLTEEHLDRSFATLVEHLWSRYSAKVFSAVRTAQEQGLASILRVVLSPESDRSRRGRSKLTTATAYERVQSFLKRQGSAAILGSQSAFAKRYSEDRTLQDVVQDIDLVEDSISEAMASRDTLQDLITQMFTANKAIRFTDESIEVSTPSGDQIGLASLSSGEKHLLRILVQSLLAGESSMMIDEPELSMHVDWQKNLIKSLRVLNPDAQLILCTHSPEVMADVPDDKIFRM